MSCESSRSRKNRRYWPRTTAGRSPAPKAMSMAKRTASGLKRRPYVSWSELTTIRRASGPVTSIGRFPNSYSRADLRHNRARTDSSLWRRIASAPRSFHEACLVWCLSSIRWGRSAAGTAKIYPGLRRRSCWWRRSCPSRGKFKVRRACNIRLLRSYFSDFLRSTTRNH